MNLNKAFILLSASTGVAGFTPSGLAAFSRHASRPRVAFVAKGDAGRSALFSEVEEATEAAVAVEDAAEATEEDFAVAAATAVAEAVAEDVAEAAAEEVTQTAAEESLDTDTEGPAAFDKTIYIGNISFDAVENDIREAFAPHGTLKKVQVPLDRKTGRCRGFAFVAMSNAEEHAAAIAAVDQTEVCGRTIYVNESLPKEKIVAKKKNYANRRGQNKSKIYVGNLDFGTTAETLKAAFEEFGEVQDCFIPTDYEGNSRGFGFIEMEEENVEKAIEGMNRRELDGRTLNVNISLPKGQKVARTQIKLYVGNLSWGTEEESLRELFEEYGKVIDIYLPTDRETGQHRGFAFVSMDPEDALRAADETDGYELDGRILRVNEAQPKGAARSYNDDNDGYSDAYDGDDAYDESADESWGNEAY